MKTPVLLHGTRWLYLLENEGWVFVSRRPPGAPARIDAVNIVALHEDGERRRLVVIEEWRVALRAWEFALPAGLVEPDESPILSATRELAEETGLALTWTGEISGPLASSAGLTDESFQFIFCGCAGTPALAPGVDGEKIRVHLCDRAACRDLLARNHSGAALSGRLWPILFSIAETGRIGAHVMS